MLKRLTKKLTLLFVLLFPVFEASAQEEAYNAYSPYSMFGIGDLSKQGTAWNKSMGGVGIASRNKKYINILNPAAVTAREAKEFKADFGLAQGNRIYRQGDFKSANNTFNIYDFVISFPVYKSIAMYAGFTPYSDCELIDGLGSNATNTSSERGNMNYNMDPGWSKISGVWDAEYGIIEDANQIIEGIRSSATLTAGGANQKSMERSLGEALTIRAMVYFDLVRIFGDIPFKVEASKADLSNAYLEKTDRDVIMDSLMNDLDEAIKYLPWAYARRKRPLDMP